jgi:hypothetical protein
VIVGSERLAKLTVLLTPLHCVWLRALKASRRTSKRTRSPNVTIRLWPMPKGRPLHTLPHDELLARLRSFTNLRVARDEGSGTGYRVEAGPFPGWAVLPEW